MTEGSERGGKKNCSRRSLALDFLSDVFRIIFRRVTSLFTNLSAYLCGGFTARCALSCTGSRLQTDSARCPLLHAGSRRRLHDLFARGPLLAFLQRLRLNADRCEHTGADSHHQPPLKSLSLILTSTPRLACSIMRCACRQSYARRRLVGWVTDVHTRTHSHYHTY